MILFDKILLLVMGVGALIGFRNGFLCELVNTFGAIVAAFLANVITPRLTGIAMGYLHNAHLAALGSWVMLFLFFMVQLAFLSKMMSAAMSSMSLSLTNKMTGAVFGAVKVALLLSFVLALAQMLSVYIPLLDTKNYAANSRIVPMLNQILAITMPWVKAHLLMPAVNMIK